MQQRCRNRARSNEELTAVFTFLPARERRIRGKGHLTGRKTACKAVELRQQPQHQPQPAVGSLQPAGRGAPANAARPGSLARYSHSGRPDAGTARRGCISARWRVSRRLSLRNAGLRRQRLGGRASCAVVAPKRPAASQSGKPAKPGLRLWGREGHESTAGRLVTLSTAKEEV